MHVLKIRPDFFARNPLICARELIGAHFLWDGRVGRIVETEAYLAHGDPACHTWKRPSARAFVEAHQAGDAYVYLNYGVHWLFNVLVKSPDAPGFVLLRALEPISGADWMDQPRAAAGPGKLTRALGIDGTVNGIRFLNGPGRGMTLGQSSPCRSGPRIGISHAKELPWRFGDPTSAALSRKF
jgi:DNA-3-methyladenine glycosylase